MLIQCYFHINYFHSATMIELENGKKVLLNDDETERRAHAKKLLSTKIDSSSSTGKKVWS